MPEVANFLCEKADLGSDLEQQAINNSHKLGTRIMRHNKWVKKTLAVSKSNGVVVLYSAMDGATYVRDFPQQEPQ